MKRRVFSVAVLLLVVTTTVQAQFISKPKSGFGRTLAFVGDELLIGEPYNGATPGTVYVYAKKAGNWGEQATITASDGRTGDWFGQRLAYDGSRIIVAAKTAAYVFERGARGWQQTAKLTPNLPVGHNVVSVALAGDVALTGAIPQSATPFGQSNLPGVVHVF